MFKRKSVSAKKTKPSIFDDFSILMENLDHVQDIDLKYLDEEEHKKAIGFYSFIKLKRYIETVV